MNRETTNRFSRQYWQRLAIFTAAAALIAAIGLLVYFVQLQANTLITPQRNSHLEPPVEISSAYQEITLTTADDLKISGWYIPGSRPEAIILVHGIHANRMNVVPQAAILAESGYHLVLIDLRGHGQSEGSETTYGYREAWDVQAAVDYLMDRPDIEQVGALGNSLGGAVVVRAAAEDSRLQAVVVESSYSSLPEAVEDAFDDLSFLPSWPFAPLVVALAEQKVGIKISEVNSARDLAALSPRSVMIIHGRQDGMFPPSHAHRMYEAAREPKQLWLVESRGHGNLVTGREAEYRQRVVSFFETAFSSEK